MKLSCIVPCYNEEAALELFYAELTRVGKTMPEVELEILFVDDGSRDKTLQIIKELKSGDERIKYISFSRNFGKEAAIFAGLSHASGDYCVMMDADLQDPPSLLPEMLQYAAEGYDIVGTKRSTRENEPPVRSFFARMFYKIINKISTADIVDGARDFQLLNRKAVNAILSLGEYNRFSKGIFGWVGFKKKWLSYENIERVAGQTKWSFRSLFKYALEGIAAFSTAPLSIATFLGVFLLLAAVVIIATALIKSAAVGCAVGSTAVLASLITAVGGLQLVVLGIIGSYLAKAYLEVKKRPIYLIGECETENEVVS